MKLIYGIQKKIFFSFIIVSTFITMPLLSKDAIADIEQMAIDVPEVADILFSYDNEDITNIINKLAALKNLNVIFPQGEALKVTVTLHIDEKITITQAWDLLNTLLDVAGFFIVPQGSMVRIVKSGKEISREPVPTYIGVDPNDLPNSDQPIRYLYYFSNIRISDQQDNELNGILKDLLPENALYKGDSATNGLLLVAKANDIRSVMNIILELDKIDFQEKVDILSLHHTSATLVARLINEQLLKAESPNPYRLDTKKTKEIPYFSGFTKIIPLEEVRLNKLILLGRPQAIERLKDFIKKYIDVAPDSGESILHVYHLQYLDAREFADVLQKIVQGGGDSSGPSQASAGGQGGAGPERFFDKVIVYTDTPLNQSGDNANTGIGEQRLTYYGGNNLVIACRNDDWKQIKKLIEELDTPQKQVLLEVLIADLTVEDSRLLGAMTRMPKKVPLADSIEFQSAMFGPVIPTDLSTDPTTPSDATIQADLLKNAYKVEDNQPVLADPASSGTNNLADFAQSGTTMLSLNDNDGETWSIWELLQLFTNSKVLSHPHVMAKNNKEALVTIGQTRWLKDTVKDVASNYYGGATTIKYKPITANLTVKITPRISSANSVTLLVSVDINEWRPGFSNAKNVRKLETIAYIKSGGIFALGGLIRTTTTNTVRETPILGKIPIIGWFFKRKTNNVIKNNLTVFISPTIIEPRLREGVSDYTQDYINIAKDYSRNDLFDSLKDPVTRWFFKEEVDTSEAINKFVEKDEKLSPMNQSSAKRRQKETPAERVEPTDPIMAKTGISIAQNTQDIMPEKAPAIAWEDLKQMLQDEPNPFVSSGVNSTQELV